MREKAKALCDVTRKIIQDRINLARNREFHSLTQTGFCL